MVDYFHHHCSWTVFSEHFLILLFDKKNVTEKNKICIQIYSDRLE